MTDRIDIKIQSYLKMTNRELVKARRRRTGKWSSIFLSGAKKVCMFSNLHPLMIKVGEEWFANTNKEEGEALKGRRKIRRRMIDKAIKYCKYRFNTAYVPAIDRLRLNDEVVKKSVYAEKRKMEEIIEEQKRIIAQACHDRRESKKTLKELEKTIKYLEKLDQEKMDRKIFKDTYFYKKK